MLWGVLAEIVVALHFCFVLFVLFGGVLTLRWPRVAWIHLPAAAWGALISFFGWVCPLTPLEKWLRQQGGGAGYEGGFIEHYLLPILYPRALTRDVQIVLGGIVIVLNLVVYWRVWRRARGAGAAAILIAAALPAPAPAVAATQIPIAATDLAPLADAIGDRRIVLLGENGHGVGELTTLKARLVEWLHRELGYEVVVMESGFFECGNAWRREATAPRDLLYRCLRYPFEHAEILPLFELIRERRASARPLELAGMDLQAQGFDSGERPAVLHAALTRIDPALARRVAALDSLLYLVPDSGGLGDRLDGWLLGNGAAARAAYDSAAALTSGFERWSFRLAGGLVDRLLARARAGAAGERPPAAFYELRDEWMARAVAAMADSIAGRRKVVVWLHNDHARYDDFESGGYAVRPVGSFLREWYGDEVYSIGFFMGRGTVADNRRRVREMAPPPAGGIEALFAAAPHDAAYLILTGSTDSAATRWAASPRPYLRMGLERREMVPAREFDALFHVDSVGAPGFEIGGM